MLKEMIRNINIGFVGLIGPQNVSDAGNSNSAIGIARVDRIAFHPTDEDIFYIGTPSGGLFRTSNGGSSWSPRSDNLPSPGISGIIVSNDDANKIYVLTGDGDSNIGGLVENYGYMRFSEGCFVSYDQGVNWTKLGDFPTTLEYVGYQLIQDPNDADILMAATSVGIFRSTDGGWNWIQITTNRTYELKYRPNDSNIIYATESATFLRSIDGGLTFNPVSLSPSIPGGRVAIAVTNANPNWVYLLSGGGGASGSTYGGLYLSIDSGASFSQRSNSPNIIDGSCAADGSGSSFANYILAIGASHVAPINLVTGSVRSWRSTNGGLNMIAASPNCGNSTGVLHADIHDIEYNPLTDEVFVCSDGGLNKSDDHGQTWESLSDGIAASQIYHMAGNNVNTTNMLIGLQDNGFKSRNNNTNTWAHEQGADGFDAYYDSGSTTDGYASINQSILSFTSNGSNMPNITPVVPGDAQWFGRVVSANTNSNIVLAGYTDIMRSTDGGTNWSNRGAAGNWDLESCPSNNTRFYATGGIASNSNSGRQMFRSDDTGQTWTSLTTVGLPAAALNIKVTDLGARPNNSNHLWATMGGFLDGQKVFFYNNILGTWANMSGTLPNVPVHTVAVDANNNAYIGTELGIYYRGNAMTDWVPFWDGIPFVPVTELVLYEDDNIIRAATFGRGVWESDTYSQCPIIEVVANNQTGNQYFETSLSIFSTAIIFGGANTNVVMKAGDAVFLQEGFRVFPQNKFRAYIAPCGEVDSNSKLAPQLNESHLIKKSENIKSKDLKQ